MQQAIFELFPTALGRAVSEARQNYRFTIFPGEAPSTAAVEPRMHFPLQHSHSC